MTVVTGILSAVVLSPLLFVALLAVSAGLALSGRKRASAWLSGATVLLVLVFSTEAFASLLLRPLENRYPPLSSPPPKVDAVVILGAGVSGRELSSIALQRLVGGFVLARSLGVPVIVSGGSTWSSSGTEPEAVVAARTLEALGMPAGLIITESRSRTTWENAQEVERILSARNLARVALVTSAWHMPRAMMSFRRAGVEPVPVPAGALSLGRRLGASAFLPDFEAARDSFLALREYIGMAAYESRR
jgi:uncharacterized SAM-binding protein YcdF (DUF218 family)